MYFQPVALAAQLARANVEVGSVPPEELYQAVLGGHAVVAWISNTYHRVALSHYVAYDGASVGYTLTEHAVTVVGVRPDAVLINDPSFGRAWRAKAQFESAYSTFANMAVVLDSP